MSMQRTNNTQQFQQSNNQVNTMLPRACLAVLLGLLAACTKPTSTAHHSPTVDMDAPAFAGTIGDTVADSRSSYLSRPRAPAGTPNVVIVVADDLGYADLPTYGGDIHTPNLDQLAAQGVRYSHFTVTAVCSPTRAALLTGLNHHSAGVGWLSEWEMGFPGYRGELRPDVATLPEILREHGFATLMVGKWHLTLSEHRSQTGPFDSWPTHRGFDRYWGFLDGETSQWHPHMLVEGTAQFLPPEDEEFYLPDALTDQAIGMIRDLRSLDPDQPFFLYYATGAPHAPHHTRASDRARYQGHYDEGYDVIRERRLARQKQLGLLPEHTRLTERNPGIVPWEELSADQQRMYARLQENYAAFVDNMDQNIGRLRDYLARIGELDNTIFLFLSDNGASREVGIEGSANVLAFFHNRPLTTAENLAYFDRIGEPETHPHYPQGWMQVSNTPFAHGKRTSWAGGVRVPFMLSWPAGLETSQPLRHQFHHVNDVAPTLLELLDIAPPERVGGRRVRPMEGISMAYSLRDPELPSRKQGQYYEVEAQRAYIEGDWKIVSYREDDEPYDARPWMLFNLSDDPAETQDLAARYPDRVEALSKAWWAAARRYDVLPLADVPLLERAFRFRRTAGDDRREWRLEPGTTPILVGAAPVTAGRSYTIETTLRRDHSDQQGVLVAHGDAYSGYSLYIQDNRLVYELHVGHTRYRVVSQEELPTGEITVGYRFNKRSTALAVAGSLLRTGGINPLETLHGEGILQVNGQPQGRVEVEYPLMAVWEGLEVGRDSGSPVSRHYQSPFAFEGELEAVYYRFD